MRSHWKILSIWYLLDTSDTSGGTENKPIKSAGDSEEWGEESFQVLWKPGSEFKVFFTPNETYEVEFSKNISKALTLGKGKSTEHLHSRKQMHYF